MYKLILIFLTIFIVSCAQPGRVRIDNVPMYGQPETPRPDFLKKADEDFINKVTAEIGDRKKASTMWYRQGDKYLKERNFDYAMRRYNQSWLLDPDNYQPYWGFGRVMLEQNRFEESIKHLLKANELIDDDYQKVALLSDIGAAYSYAAENEKDKNKKQNYYRLSFNHFTESTKMDSSYGRSWLQWAIALYGAGNYKEAKEKYDVAKSKGEKQENFEKALTQKLLK